MSIPRDIQQFLDRYPGNHSDSSETNLRFYSNTKTCRPDDMLINEIHKQWQGDYNKLEHNHGFIQWLFPIQEFGMNWDASPLQQDEIERMKAEPLILERILTSYRLMLDFYGMELVSEETGLLQRTTSFAERYRNLCRSSHNNLRISRILKCLSELGFERLNAGFVLHVLNEQSQNLELNTPGIRSSMDNWWANCLRNDAERNCIQRTISQVRSTTDDFVFTRQTYEDALTRRRDTGSFGDQL